MTSLERLALEIVAGVVLVIATVLYLEHRGAAACKAADVEAVTKQETINEAKESKAIIEITDEDKTYHEAVTAPVDAPVVRVCRNQASPVLPTTTSPSGPNVQPPIRTELIEGPDIGKPILTEGRNADAQVKALQEYVTKVCLAR